MKLPTYSSIGVSSTAVGLTGAQQIAHSLLALLLQGVGNPLVTVHYWPPFAHWAV
jgi:hypothetical protein